MFSIRMAMHVDETRREREPMFIANGLPGFRRELFPDLNDLVALNRGRPRALGLAAPVINQHILQ